MDFINTDNFFNTSNGLILAILEDDIVVPQTLHDAVLRIEGMNITQDDSILVEMYCENNPDYMESIMFWAGFEEGKFWFYWSWIYDSDDKMNNLKSYRNFKCLDWSDWKDCRKMECCSLSTADIDYALRFLTDYFMFLNPKVKTEDILVDVTLNPEPSFDE